MFVLVTALGRILLRGSRSPGSRLGALVVTLAVGAASFCCLGVALTDDHPVARAPRRRSPTWRSSRSTSCPGVFIPESEIPERRARTSPTCSRSATSSRRFFTGFEPGHRRSRLRVGNLAVVAAWGLAGLARRRSSRFRLGHRAGIGFRACFTTPASRSRISSGAAGSTTRLLGPLGWRRQVETDEVIAWGIVKPVFFASARRPAGTGGGHVCFSASGTPAVKAAWEGGVASGGADDGAPGNRPQYGPGLLLRLPA